MGQGSERIMKMCCYGEIELDILPGVSVKLSCNGKLRWYLMIASRSQRGREPPNSVGSSRGWRHHHKLLGTLPGIKPIPFDAKITILPSELQHSLFSLGVMFRRPNLSRAVHPTPGGVRERSGVLRLLKLLKRLGYVRGPRPKGLTPTEVTWRLS
jgi:hypothetical protein